jgi:hypothetical protein
MLRLVEAIGNGFLHGLSQRKAEPRPEKIRVVQPRRDARFRAVEPNQITQSPSNRQLPDLFRWL